LKFSFLERDLDLIQLEELHADNGYSIWFAERIGLAGLKFQSAAHSVWATVNGESGETDVLAFFRGENETCAVLIEDNISADFTHQQAQKYVERGEALVLEGKADRFLTVLVAPSVYLESIPSFEPWKCRLPIEEIADWFGTCEGHHAMWRREAFENLLNGLSRSMNTSTEDVVRFSRAFSRYLAERYAPNFWHKPGKDRSGPIIRYRDDSDKKRLWWKVATNQMTLQLMNEYQGLAERIELPVGVSLEAAKDHERKCDYLVAPVDTVDLSEPFDGQLAAVEDAMDAALKLVDVVLPQIETLLDQSL